jgi:6-phosphogluconolactonase (cycloisomerase 2 family)
MAVDPTGAFLSITTNQATSEVLTYAINAAGQLSSSPTSVRAQGNGQGVGGPVGIAYSIGTATVAYGTQFVDVVNSTDANIDGNSVMAFTVTPGTGTLTLASTSTPPASEPGPPGWEAITLDPLGRFAFVAEGENNDIAAFTIDTTSGALGFSGFSSSIGDNPVDGFCVDPDGQFLFAAGGDTKPFFTCFTIGSQALLSAPSTQTFASAPQSCFADPAGTYVFQVGATGASTYVYAGGTLTANGGTPEITNPGTLSGMVVPPSSRFAYILDSEGAGKTIEPDVRVATPSSTVAVPSTSGQIDVCSISPADGTLNFAGQIVAGAAGDGGINAPFAIVSDPFGQFIYVLNEGNTISGFQIGTVVGSAGDGQLTVFPAFAAGAFPIANSQGAAGMAIDAAGQFLWVIDSTGATVTPFVINRTTGALTQGTATSTGTGTALDGIAVLGVPR